MGIKKKKKVTASSSPEPPQLGSRRSHRQSTYQMGRTISEKREVLEKRSEREAARKEDKRREFLRVFFTFLGFAILIAALIFLLFFFVGSGEPETTQIDVEEVAVTTEPTIEIVDEDASAGGQITSRMRNYIGQAEQDFRDLGFTPTKVVIPAGTIREVDFYINGKPGFVKMTIDRGTAVSVEDAERMYRYLESSGISDYSYIDVRIAGKAYWK